MKDHNYNATGQLRRDSTLKPDMKDSNFKAREVAAKLYGIPGCDATDQQVANANRAINWYRQGYAVSKIILLLRIKRAAPASPTLLDGVISLSPI